MVKMRLTQEFMQIFTMVSKTKYIVFTFGTTSVFCGCCYAFPQKTFVNEYKKAFPSQKDGKAVVPPSLVLLRPTLSPVT